MDWRSADSDPTFSPQGPFQMYRVGIGSRQGIIDALYECNFEFKPSLRQAERACSQYRAIGFGTANFSEPKHVVARIGTAFVVYGKQDGSVTLRDVLRKLTSTLEPSKGMFYAKIVD